MSKRFLFAVADILLLGSVSVGLNLRFFQAHYKIILEIQGMMIASKIIPVRHT